MSNFVFFSQDFKGTCGKTVKGTTLLRRPDRKNCRMLILGCRQRFGLSRSEFAQYLGISVKYLILIERGRIELNEQEYDLLMDRLYVNIGFLN